MSGNIVGKNRKVREIISARFTRQEVYMALTDFALPYDGYPDSMSDDDWFFHVIENLERKKQLQKLATALADQLNSLNDGDEDAVKLRQLVDQPVPPPPEPTPIPKPTPIPEITTKPFTGIILLGEPMAMSVPEVVEARGKLASVLVDAFKEKNIPVIDWGDRWDTARGPTAEPDHVNFLFVRIINSDLASDIETLNAIPRRLGTKLRLPAPTPISQVMGWNCDQAAVSAQPQHGISFTVRSDPAEQFATILKSRFGFEKSPPTISMENTGDNRAIEERLIEFVSARTKGICRPPDPQLIYMGEGGTCADTGTALRQLLDKEVSRGGVIIAIHDLNVQMTDNANDALLEFKNRLAEYDKLLAPIIKETEFPGSKILKLAVIMNLGKALLKAGQFGWQYQTKGWVIIGMKRENDEAVLAWNPDQQTITNRIDDLLRQN
jgi:hypothetical protein